ncbi:MAG: hypothetical protein H7834_02775 [Magnetococcus sp. YQC-9]
MSQSLTFDDVWKMFQETSRQFQEMVREDRERRAEYDRREKERLLREQERLLREQEQRVEFERRALERVAEYERREQERRAEYERREQERIAENDRRKREIDLQMQKTDLQITRVGAQIGELGSRWGQFVEGIVSPACATLFTERGIPVHKYSRNVQAFLADNRQMEIDVLVVNTSAVVLVEVKSRLQKHHIRKHIERLAEFKSFFPEYADKQVMGAVAGIVIDEQVDRHAMKQGLFVIVQAGEGMVKLANSPDFKPKSW